MAFKSNGLQLVHVVFLIEGGLKIPFKKNDIKLTCHISFMRQRFIVNFDKVHGLKHSKRWFFPKNESVDKSMFAACPLQFATSPALSLPPLPSPSPPPSHSSSRRAHSAAAQANTAGPRIFFYWSNKRRGLISLICRRAQRLQPGDTSVSRRYIADV